MTILAKETSYDKFLSGYRQAVLFADLDEGLNPSEVELSESFMEKTRNDCTMFFQKNILILMDAVDVPGYDWYKAGSDFWLTRKGHGAGYWDGDLPDEIGDLLTEKAQELLTHQCVYVGDDGLVYLE